METEKRKPGRVKKQPIDIKKARQIYATDVQWEKIQQLAKDAGMDVSPFVIKAVLL